MSCLNKKGGPPVDFVLNRERANHFIYDFKVNTKALRDELVAHGQGSRKRRRMTISFDEGFKQGHINIGDKAGTTFGIGLDKLSGTDPKDVSLTAIAQERNSRLEKVGEARGVVKTLFNVKSATANMAKINREKEKEVERAETVDKPERGKSSKSKNKRGAKNVLTKRVAALTKTQQTVKQEGDAPMQSYSRTDRTPQHIRNAAQLREHIAEYNKVKIKAMALWEKMRTLPELQHIEDMEVELNQAVKDKKGEAVESLQAKIRAQWAEHQRAKPEMLVVEYKQQYQKLSALKEKIDSFVAKKMSKN